MPCPSWHPDIALADLRVRQGRLADAEALLLGKDQSMQALLPAARLHLARGDHELARADGPARAAGRSATTGCGRSSCWPCWSTPSSAAATSTRRRRRRATSSPSAPATSTSPPLQARAAARPGARAGGRRRPRRRDRRRWRRRSTGSIAARLPWLRATLLARPGPAARGGRRPRAAPTLDATAAAAILARLDVVLAAADAALLDRLGADAGRRRVDGGDRRCARRRQVVDRSCADGTSVRLPDTKGLRYLAELVARPGVERHALDLVDRVEGVAVDGGSTGGRSATPASCSTPGPAPRTGAGSRQLRADADDALAAGQLETAEAAQDELDQLVAPAGAGVRPRRAGAGGRHRPPSGPASTSPGRCAPRSPSSPRPCPRPARRSTAGSAPACTAPTSRTDDDDVRWIVQS